VSHDRYIAFSKAGSPDTMISSLLFLIPAPPPQNDEPVAAYVFLSVFPSLPSFLQ